MASGPYCFMANKRGKVEAVTDFIFLGTKITMDSDCHHEIKRCLLLGRNAMTNLDSTLNSRDITLPTKVHIVKAMAFPVVMYGCESWTKKKADCFSAFWLRSHVESWLLKNWCFWTVVLEKTLESPLDYEEIKPINPKGNQPWIFTEGLMLKLKLQYFGHLMQRADSWEKSLLLGKIKHRKRRGRQRM